MRRDSIFNGQYYIDHDGYVRKKKTKELYLQYENDDIAYTIRSRRAFDKLEALLLTLPEMPLWVKEKIKTPFDELEDLLNKNDSGKSVDK